MTGQLPVFSLKPTDTSKVIAESNASASSVFVIVGNKKTSDQIDDVAAVDGVDVLLIRSHDLTIELGVPAGFRTDVFRSALEAVSKSC